MQKAQYKTKQMAELLSYLESVRGSHVTVSDICRHFSDQGITIGTTTVYRQLDRMVQQGLVAKYTVDATSSACFEYIGGKTDDKPTCLHCKCECCGRLIHLHCDEAINLGHHILEHHDFQINPLRTVFYGICSSCRTQQS